MPHYGSCLFPSTGWGIHPPTYHQTKWQTYWDDNQTFRTPERNPEKEKKLIGQSSLFQTLAKSLEEAYKKKYAEEK